MSYKLSDFKVGQTAYVMSWGDAARRIGRDNIEALVQPCVVKSIGRKYIVVGSPNGDWNDHKYEENQHGCFIGLPEHSTYSVNNVLYPERQPPIDELKKKKLWSLCVEKMRYTDLRTLGLSLSQVQQIAEILGVETEVNHL
jgi:hypothetical protein